MHKLMLALCFALAASAQASAVLETNSVRMLNAPAWITAAQVRRVSTKIENFLEWDIRRVQVLWYTDSMAFSKAHGLGPSVLAATDRKSHQIHMGPAVTAKNFEGIFGHELAHVIVIQKYKTAIPAWLEEGLANYVSEMDVINFDFLNSQPYQPVATLTHPYKSGEDPRYHYQASTALMKMIAQKCPIKDLLQLSVGKKIETYLKTFCEINDLDASFRKWLKSQSTK